MRDQFMFTIIVNNTTIRGQRYFRTFAAADKAMFKFMKKFAKEFGPMIFGYVHM